MTTGRAPTGEFPYAHCGYHAHELRDHETRLRKLETAYWKLLGGVTVAAGIAAFVGGLLTKLIP